MDDHADEQALFRFGDLGFALFLFHGLSCGAAVRLRPAPPPWPVPALERARVRLDRVRGTC
jgi:hypothetical protein